MSASELAIIGGGRGMPGDSAEIRVGSWKIMEDPYGSLFFEGKSSWARVDKEGRIMSGKTSESEGEAKKYIRDGDPVNINKFGYADRLNSTTKGDSSHPNGYKGWTYWADPADGESNLQINYGPYIK
ncbi:hypothetical protein GNZ18_03570 [Actinomadura sp. NEAU-AAG5]|uniref:Uncharacterized protein n=1 Tax=Actinomadura litoris TaxID=2678616 RepID=A0A7K1KUF8_9ACTN|nr:hypothetical protein [Actinomadura litoris]